MAKVSLSNIKTRFETGDRPTGADYVDLIDTLAAQATDLGTDGNNENTIYGIENSTVLETLNASQWRIVKYVIGISHTANNANKYYATELSVLIDKEDLNVSEYAVLDSDGDIGTVNVSRNGNTLTLSVTPNPAIRPITVRYFRTGLKA
jgi:nitrogen fixation protein